MSTSSFKQSEQHKVPAWVESSTEVVYRSAGLGIWGTVLRMVGMPLEKIALTVNSSQVSGRSQFTQACNIVFRDGWLAPYRVITPRSIFAWYVQFSIMGFSFQIADRALATALNISTCPTGDEVVTRSFDTSEIDIAYTAKTAIKLVTAPILAACVESGVSNKAEVTRFYGPQKYAQIQSKTVTRGMLRKMTGPAFGSGVARNSLMSASSFVWTPYLYMLAVPEEARNSSDLFWCGLGVNIFAGNVVGAMTQSLWGRSLDFYARNHTISYRQVIQEGLKQEGVRAFLTPTKWFTRVIFNAPATGTIPWFYNTILPIGEPKAKELVRLAHAGLCSQGSPILAQKHTKPYQSNVVLQNSYARGQLVE